MVSQARMTKYIVPYAVEMDGRGEKILKFRMEQDSNGYYTYANMQKNFCNVVEYEGSFYRLTGWDSDYGTVIYKPVSKNRLCLFNFDLKV